MKHILSLFLISICFIAARAQTPDWSTSVAAIIYNNCSVCHHQGNIAPFPLMSYDDAVTNAFTLQADVNAHKMPPWPADPNYNHFWGERVLSDNDISAINDWVNGGMPSGNLALAPQPPVYNGAISMVAPDDTVFLPAYTVTTDFDDYRTFVVHSGYTTAKYLNQIEFIPGDPAIVHHVIYHQDTSDIPWLLDQADSLPGYPNNGFGDPSPSSINFGGWNPGKGIFKLLPNMGFKILPGSDYVISIHYAPGSMGHTDSSRIYLKFCNLPDSVIRPIYQQRYLYNQPPSLINGPLFVQANTVKTFYEESEVFPQKVSTLGLSPHSHLVCKSWEVFMVTTPGDTTKLISIPQWYFNWQYNYMFTKVLEIPAGAQLFDNAVFDNTTNNPSNPNNPPLDIHFGQSTTQEMMNCRFWVMYYQPGDSNIILDSAYYGLGVPTSIPSPGTSDLSLQAFPNPASDVLHLSAYLPAHEVSWTLTNSFGNDVKSNHQMGIDKGVYLQDIDLNSLTAGIYILSIHSGQDYAYKKFVVIK
jgi:hypothetical protein